MWPRKDEKFDVSVEDYADNEELFTLLQRLPAELRAMHLMRISGLDDAEATEYLRTIHEKRSAATREAVVSDAGIRDYFSEHAEEVWEALETDVFTDTDNLLGFGQTARIKRFVLNDTGRGQEVPLAIKYLVTPTEKTLSASGEHDLILEVERMFKIEQAEAEHAHEVPHVRVPHPYFHYQRSKIQCYGMELIDGINLAEGISGDYEENVRSELRATLAGIDRQALLHEVDIFFDTMHGVCLHGDIKPANLMVSREGKFYVIDFGQSVLANDIDDKAREAFDTLKDDEKVKAKLAITHFLNALESNPV